MTVPPKILEALATAFARSERTVVLTGLAIGGPLGQELENARGEWSERASLDALVTNPSDFWAFYHPHARHVAARTPGPGHHALARLQSAGLVHAIVTQAVDRLHRRASEHDPHAEIVEVHGTVTLVRCERCGERYGLGEVEPLIAAAADGVPRCSTPGCGFPLRPAGTLWGEPLVQEAVKRAWDLAGQADCFVVVDSELRTVPMSLLPSVPLTRGVPLAILTAGPTQYDRYAEVVTREPSVDVLVALADLLAPRHMSPPG